MAQFWCAQTKWNFSSELQSSVQSSHIYQFVSMHTLILSKALDQILRQLTLIIVPQNPLTWKYLCTSYQVTNLQRKLYEVYFRFCVAPFCLLSDLQRWKWKDFPNLCLCSSCFLMDELLFCFYQRML